MSLKLITPPNGEPITLNDAKLHLRIEEDVTAEDSYLESLIVAAREGAEHITGRALMEQTWALAMDRFYDCRELLYRPGPQRFAIQLPKAPLIDVESVTYIDTAGAEKPLAPEMFQVDDFSEPGRILPAYGTCWPETRCQANSVTITFKAGYGAAEDVPQQIKNWMLLRIGMLYENRESVSAGQPIQEMPQADRLLDAYRLWSFS